MGAAQHGMEGPDSAGPATGHQGELSPSGPGGLASVVCRPGPPPEMLPVNKLANRWHQP
jgi:hypothetical protein